MTQKNIWDSITETQTIFIEKDFFTVEYDPEIINHRDNQINKILHNLKGRLDSNKRPYHMVLKGAYATGKTISIKYIFNEAEKKFPNVTAVHINCKQNKTAYLIYLKIYEKLFKKDMGVGGLSTSAVLDKIMKKIVKEDIILLIALDDIGSVKNNRDLNDVLYNLLRGHESAKNAKISLFPVTNERELLFLDFDVQTVFNHAEVDFPKYTFNEIYDIINERCRLGLYNGAISDEIINDVSKYCFNQGDLRKGFDEIYKAGLNAEYEGCHKIQKSHFN